MQNRTNETSDRIQHIPAEVIAHHLSDHETRLNAIAAQNIHMGIMIEYMFEQLTEIVPEFQLDREEFEEYRNRRFDEMKAEAIELEEARRKTQLAEEALRRGETPVDLDLDEDTV